MADTLDREIARINRWWQSATITRTHGAYALITLYGRTFAANAVGAMHLRRGYRGETRMSFPKLESE